MEAHPPPQHRPETILVVDDDILIRMSIADYLRGSGFEVIEAGDADEAVAVLTTDTPVDLVFSDVQMPGSIDGFGLARWVRANRAHIRVILASGVVRAAAAAELDATDAFLEKPFQMRQVTERLEMLLGHGG